jgi:SAM-dependent methyltransferase
MKNRTNIFMEEEKMEEVDTYRYMTLDVGCGYCFRGDVNVDLYTDATVHRSDPRVQLRGIPNFVNCSVEYLPFKDRAFDRVTSYHVIEHVDDPYLTLKELIRVCNRHLLIRCPHRFGAHARNPEHKNLFTRTWFVHALTAFQKVFAPLYWRTGVSRRRPFLWFVPDEIEVEVFRGQKVLK